MSICLSMLNQIWVHINVSNLIQHHRAHFRLHPCLFVTFFDSEKHASGLCELLLIIITQFWMEVKRQCALSDDCSPEPLICVTRRYWCHSFGLGSKLHHLVAVWPWLAKINYLCLGVFAFQMSNKTHTLDNWWEE
jgi:hypothetical protein